MLCTRSFLRHRPSVAQRSLAVAVASSSGSAGMSRNQSTSHEERTSKEPRDPELHRVRIQHIERVNSTIRTLRLELLDPDLAVKFFPGQWLDVHIPDLPKAGGFTITSPPADAIVPQFHHNSIKQPFRSFELAVQYAERNPAARWLWKPDEDILGAELDVRVGGSFVWPPRGQEERATQNVLMVAGGVGINPFSSMLSHFQTARQMPDTVKLLYSTKQPSQLSEILFVTKFQNIAKETSQNFSMELFLTGDHPEDSAHAPGNTRHITRVHSRRILESDLVRVLGDVKKRKDVVCYICGPQKMTDEFVAYLKGLEGVDAENVLCEKWW